MNPTTIAAQDGEPESNASATETLDDAPEDVDDEPGEEEEEDDAAAVPAAATPIALPALDPVAVDGVFRGLAMLLTQKGTTLLLGIAKTGDERLRVTVQLPPASDEPAESVIPLTLVATPEEMDTQFVTALASYKPGRDYATASAAEIVRATKAAADQSRAAAEAKRKNATSTSRSHKPSGALIVTTVPANATITVAGNDGRSLTAASARPLTLPVGKATITATAEGHKTRITTVTIAQGKTEKLDLDLPSAEPSLF